jgi:hypothetical protein
VPPPSCSDEDHVRPLDRLFDLVCVFFCGQAADLWISPCAQALGDRHPELDLVGTGRSLQRLDVRVGGEKLHSPELGGNHVVDGIAAGPSHADDFDPGCVTFFFFYELKFHECPSFVLPV